MKQTVAVLVVLLFALGTVYAGGQQEGTSIRIESLQSGRAYISPNDDGVLDALEIGQWLAIDRGTEPDQQRAIKVFELAVFGTEGTLAGTEVRQTRLVESGTRSGLRNLFNIGSEPTVELPESLAWDGTFLGSPAGTDGERVPDGDYVYQLSLVDETGELVRSAPRNVTVDTQAPRITSVEPLATIFSPNDDGVRDEVEIRADLSAEQQWIATFTDSSGSVVKTITYQNSSGIRSQDVRPTAIVWGGTGESGAVVSEGTYSFTLQGIDRAGNSAAASVDAISLSLNSGDIELAASRTVFSPNDDGVNDSIELTTAVSEPAGIVSWSVVITPAERPEAPVRTYTGSGEPETTLSFDGTTGGGIEVPDDLYVASFQIEYNNGNQVAAAPVEITVDRVAPSGTIFVQTEPVATDFAADAPLAFGGPEKTTLRLRASLSEESSWSGFVTTDSGTIFAPLADLGLGGPELEVAWNGLDLSGEEVPDGVYTLYLQATDEAGNVGQTNRITAIKETDPVGASIAADAEYVSPNGDGVMESIVFALEYTENGLIDDFLLSINDFVGRVRRSQYVNQPFDSFEWFGRSNGNSVLEDGTYTAELEVVYFNGARATATLGGLRIDSTPPQVESFSVPYTLFSPDGDGNRDTFPVSQRTSTETKWIGAIVSSSGDEVFSLQWRGQASDFEWDGTDPRGIIVPDGDYTYRLISTDAAGNTTVFERAIVVDTRIAEPASPTQPDQPVFTTTRRPAAAMTVFPVPFTPDGDGSNDRLTISMIAEAGGVPLERWQLEILGPDGTPIREFGGEGRPPRTITWDGVSSDGALVESAQDYAAVLTVVDESGEIAQADALVPIGILVVAEGDIYRIMVPNIQFAPFSPNLFDVTSEQLQKNLQTLRDLARVLKRFPEYDITIEGHAVHQVFDPVGKAVEQSDELLPLSEGRAEEVRQALIILGIERDRLSAVGYGGARPIVPHEDFENQWRNRRVEFVLQEQ